MRSICSSLPKKDLEVQSLNIIETELDIHEIKEHRVTAGRQCGSEISYLMVKQAQGVD